MNQERIRERKGTFNGHVHRHAGRHSEQMRIDSAMEAEEHAYQARDFDHNDYTAPIDKIPEDQEIILFYRDLGGEG